MLRSGTGKSKQASCLQTGSIFILLFKTNWMKRLACFLVALFLITVSFAQTIKGNYAIKNVQTGLLLRIKDANGKNGTPLVAYSPQNWKCMTWNFKQVEGNTYQLQNLFTGKTFEPVHDSSVQNITLSEQPLESKASQQYEFIPAGNNSYLIKLKGTDLYITSPTDKEVVNANIILAKKNGADTQRWTIHMQNPTM